MLRDFKAFILRGNVVDLAVAVVIGTAFTDVIKALVADMFTPLLSIFSKQTNFSELAVHIRGARFAYGAFINSVLAFLIVAFVVFLFVVKPVNYMMDRRRRGQPAPDEPLPDEIVLLKEIRDLLSSQRAS